MFNLGLVQGHGSLLGGTVSVGGCASPFPIKTPQLERLDAIDVGLAQLPSSKPNSR